jgi:hypothetical protein
MNYTPPPHRDNAPFLQGDQTQELAQEPRWVSKQLGGMILRAMLTRSEPARMIDRAKFLTLDGGLPRRDGSLMPVYRFDIRGITIKLCGNAGEWHVRVWSDDRVVLPRYLLEPMLTHVDEIFAVPMVEGESEPAYMFNVVGTAPLYAILWALCDGLRTLLDDTNATPCLATEVAPSATPEA